MHTPIGILCIHFDTIKSCMIRNRVLVTSIPVWHSKSGSNTLSALFDGYGPEYIANIYTKAPLPDSAVAGRYFQISEGRVLKSVFCRSIKTGLEVKASPASQESVEVRRENSIYALFTNIRLEIFLWIREFLWKIGVWKTKELDDFITSFSPDILFFPIESYFYLNRLNKYIIEHHKPKKVIGYLWDDNFTYKQKPYSLAHKITRYFLKKSVAELVDLCDTVLAISPKMKLECDREFGVNSVVLSKPMMNVSGSEYRRKNGPIRLLYTGSLVIGRDKSLLMLAKAIDLINATGNYVKLSIYSNTHISKRMYREISQCRLCDISAAIPHNQVFAEQEKSDILVIAESLDSRQNVARLSFSTKITDCLSARRCILAIGKPDSASIEYLKENHAAILCSTENEILKALKSILSDESQLSDYATRAYLCGQKNHDSQLIKERLHSELDMLNK